MFLLSNLQRPTQLRPPYDKAATEAPRRGTGEVPTRNRNAVRPRCPPLAGLPASSSASAETQGAGREANAQSSAQPQAASGSPRSCAALGMFTPRFPRSLPRIHLARPEGLKGHLPTKGHSDNLGSAGPALRTPQPAPRRTAPRRVRALPARGESCSPLTGPTRRHWKSFRTSSQLRKPSLRVDPTRARRRRQRQPTRQVCASIIGVLVTPFPAVDPTLPARLALQALEKAWRSRFPRGAICRWAGTPASPAGTWLSPEVPQG